MLKKSGEQAQKEEKLFDQFMCSCKSNLASLKQSTGAGQEKVPQLEASIEETSALKTSLTQEVGQAKEDRSSAENSLKEAQALRTSDSKTFAKESTEAKENIKSITGAIAALEKGMSQQEFLQTESAPWLQGLLTVGKPAKAYDRDALSAFLQQGDQSEDSGEILGILKQMKEDMEHDLKEMTEGEADAVAQFAALSAAKTKEIADTNAALEEKNMRLATVKVQLVQLKADLKDSKENLAGDQEAFGKTNQACTKRDTEYGILSKQFADEKVALSETIKILADDSTLHLFRKTVATAASASAATFLQIGSVSRWRQQEALEILRKTSAEHPDQPAFQQIAKRVASVARKGARRSKKGFDKIVGLVDNMLRLLDKEAKDELMKKDMCEKGLAKNEDAKANLGNGIKSLSSEIANLKEQLSIVERDMQKLSEDLATSDKTVAQSTKQRQEENAEYTEMLSDTNQAVGILEVAKNRLKEFYKNSFVQSHSNSKHRAEPPSFLQEGQSESDSEEATDEYQFLDDSSRKSGTSRHKKQPQTDAAKTVLTMIEQIQMDLKSEFSEAKKEEMESQADYEDLLATAKKKRETTARAMTEKEGAKAGLQEELKKQKDYKNGLEEELQETNDVISDLHEDCDKLLRNFQERTKLRNAEKEALQRAKSVLAGADFKS
mmetsp:Transcript_122853/g.192843  ORF Transcript_122853/g.192843 Transcript_122853/m.192843 type:complete len:666 (+) Transcript_122853:2-1999(+)